MIETKNTRLEDQRTQKYSLGGDHQLGKLRNGLEN